MTREVEALNTLIEGIEVAMLTTVHPNGQLHSRPMIAQPADTDGILWFLTAADSALRDEIRSSNDVNVAYTDTARGRYLSVSATCELLRNHQKAQQLWSSRYEPWFPKGIGDPDLILLKITINTAEYWDREETLAGSLIRALEGSDGAIRAAHGILEFRSQREDVV